MTGKRARASDDEADSEASAGANRSGKKAKSAGKLRHKSPAEFFAEHQNIAGFDNPGKSLYTTIREFVENSLDACEAVPVLPNITLEVEELDTETFNELRGIKTHQRSNNNLYKDTHAAKEAAKRRAKKRKRDTKAGDAKLLEEEETASKSSSKKATAYFRVTCKDNGIGMVHDEVPRMLGIVLSSTKYGVKQTRGKFGLGAKMALVWSKKSTGLPIEVWTAQRGHKKTFCKLDLDIHKNKPNIISHQQIPNKGRWAGTEISVVISGNWSVYRPKVIKYMRQLAIITPYAHFELKYSNLADEKKDFKQTFKRRSDMLPRPPFEVKHHPSSVDNLLVETLAQNTSTRDLKNFLCKEFSKIPAKLAVKLLAELNIDPKLSPKKLTKKQIHILTTLMHEAQFEEPDGGSLSPAGEYNLRLGINKEISPDFVSTWSSPCYSHQGHPFIIEAGVSIGGTGLTKPGLAVFRFANRIPLLFEGGNDVASQVANKRIKWGQYKIRVNQDKIGVFVSMVSTKIPFKGTSKEYIGDDNGILHYTIKQAIEECCRQLKRKISHQQAKRAQAERRSQIVKFIPDVANQFERTFEVLAGLQNEVLDVKADSLVADGGHGNEAERKHMVEVLKDVKADKINAALITHFLREHVSQHLAQEQALEHQNSLSQKREAQNIWIGTFNPDESTRYGLVKTSKFNFQLQILKTS